MYDNGCAGMTCALVFYLSADINPLLFLKIMVHYIMYFYDYAVALRNG